MLHLKLLSAHPIPLEAEVITPDNLAGKSPAEITCLPLQHGNAVVPLGEFFAVEGDASDRDIVVEGDCRRVKLLGAAMSRGRLTVRGDAGMHLGAEMKGGEIVVHGNVGDWAGAEMRGGRIHVRGNAGNLVGGAYRGSRVGMRGGVLLVDGNAGNEVGCTLRRGLIAVGGDVADFAGVSMIAGSILVFGRVGVRTGAGMKRGSIAVFGAAPQLLPTFRYDCVYQPVFLPLYLRQLRSFGFAVPEAAITGLYQRYSGDLLTRGRGELFHWRQ